MSSAAASALTCCQGLWSTTRELLWKLSCSSCPARRCGHCIWNRWFLERGIWYEWTVCGCNGRPSSISFQNALIVEGYFVAVVGIAAHNSLSPTPLFMLKSTIICGHCATIPSVSPEAGRELYYGTSPNADEHALGGGGQPDWQLPRSCRPAS